MTSHIKIASPIKSISSAGNESVKAATALHLKKNREETGLFLAEGLRLLEKAKAQGVLPQKLFFDPANAQTQSLRPIQEAVQDSGGEVLAVSQDLLRKITRRENPQAVVGVFHQTLTPLSQLKSDHKTIMALEGVRDPGNLGTIIRTAEAVGAGGLILIGECCDPFSIEAVRASMDSIFGIPLAVASLREFKAYALAYNGMIVGTSVQPDAEDYRAAQFKAPVLLVMGSEQNGLSAEARAICHKLVKLPMENAVESLNLAVAAGVMLFQLQAREKA